MPLQHVSDPYLEWTQFGFLRGTRVHGVTVLSEFIAYELFPFGEFSVSIFDPSKEKYSLGFRQIKSAAYACSRFRMIIVFFQLR